MIKTHNGELLFTDPPYGLTGEDASPLKELSFNGVYQLNTDGTLRIIDKTLTRPNGIGLSPDEQRLYVSVSDPDSPVIMHYQKDSNNTFQPQGVWFDASPYRAQGLPGLPDGMAVSRSGYLFASGPGGIFIIAPTGKLLGRLTFDKPVSNCTLDDKEEYLFVTASDKVWRVALSNKFKDIAS